MTINEFRFWLEGYSYCIKQAPTVEQWQLILKKLDLITNPPPQSVVYSTPWVGNVPCGTNLASKTLSILGNSIAS